MRRAAHRWRGDDDDRELEAALRARPSSGPEPTADDTYHDASLHDPDVDVPWLDRSDDREAEL